MKSTCLLALAALLILSCFSVPLCAAEEGGFRLETLTAGAVDQEALSRFLEETARLVPQAMRARIGHPILVSFEKLDSRTEIEFPPCSPEETTGNPQIYGRDTLSRSGNEIIINSLFLKEIARGPENARTYLCGHRTGYALAQATVLHEIAHIYDLYSFKPGEPYADEVSWRGGTISSDPLFINLFNFRMQWVPNPVPHMTETQKNELPLRSPDPYEFKNVKEAFAVNFEYFALDPQFRCRRPEVFLALERKLGPPGVSSDCKPFTQVELNTGAKAKDRSTIDLDPARIYQVHLLLAGAGTSLMSREGHAMLRLIVCAPERKKVGPDCLKDQAYHVVVSFLANIPQLRLSFVQGVFGGYASRLNLFPLPEIVGEYTEAEFRDLFSVPLKLTEEEKHDLIYRILDLHWSYEGRYFFFSNNCATEILELLQGAFDDVRAGWIHAKTPFGVLDGLARAGLVDRSVLNSRREAIHHGYIFPSRKPVLEQAYETLAAASPELARMSLEDYLEKTSPDERRRIFDSFRQTRETAAAFAWIEGHIANLNAENLNKKAAADLVSNVNPEMRQAALFLRSSPLPGAGLSASSGSYGIPLPDEVARASNAASADADTRRQLVERLQNWVKNRFVREARDYDATVENNDYFISRLLTLKSAP